MQRISTDIKKDEETYNHDFISFVKELTESGDEFAFEHKLDLFFKNPPQAQAPEPIKELDNLLEDNFVLGEAMHKDITSKAFLIENMSRLKQAGFTTLFMEHLFYDDQQELDDYFSGRASLKPETKERLQKLYGVEGSQNDEWKKYNFFQIIEAAKSAQIRVVGIDTIYTYQTQYNPEHMKRILNLPSGESIDNYRLQSLNYTDYKIIQREAKKTKCKWLAFVGICHIKSFSFISDNSVPGISELMGVRAMLTHDVEFNRPAITLIKNAITIQEHEFNAEVIVLSNPNNQPVRFSRIDKENREKLELIINSIASFKVQLRPAYLNMILISVLKLQKSDDILDNIKLSELLKSIQESVKNKLKPTSWLLSKLGEPVDSNAASFNQTLYEICEKLKPTEASDILINKI